MPTLRIAMAQMNPVVGDLAGNTELVLESTKAAAEQGADLVLCPEMALTGYPVEDLALRRSFIEASESALTDLARRLSEQGLGSTTVVVGHLAGDTEATPRLGRPRYSPRNAAAVLHQGEVLARYFKQYLPNYGVFDEARYFVPGEELLVVNLLGADVALAICEDLWQEGGLMDAVRAADVGLLAVLNGSPYEQNKDDARYALCRRRAIETGCSLAYVNLVGGQDELVFDGDSMLVDPSGQQVARAAQLQTDLLVVDVDLPSAAPRASTSSVRRVVVPADDDAAPREPLRPRIEAGERLGAAEETYRALVVGVRDYVAKNGFASVVLGLSGGIDSALTAAIAVDALGPDRVVGVAMPSEYSSEHSRADAADLADRTGLDYREVPIAPMVKAFTENLTLTGLAEENLQARIRGVILMGLSNQEGHLVLATGNKSEISVGYSTIYGDAVGGFAPIKDVAKRQVWELARWRNEVAERWGETAPIPSSSITKPPSAELRPGQLDSDSLPDYDLLDDLLDHYVEQDMGAQDLLEAGFDAGLVREVLQLTDRAEYKRRQYPPGPKISVRNFGRDRRLPITSRWREQTPD